MKQAEKMEMTDRMEKIGKMALMALVVETEKMVMTVQMVLAKHMENTGKIASPSPPCASP